MAVKRYVAGISQTARQSPEQYSFVDVLRVFWIGCAYQRIHERPKAPLVKKHLRQMHSLAESSAKSERNADETRRRCRDEMKKGSSD